MYYKFSKYIRVIYYKTTNECYIYSSKIKKEIIVINDSVKIVLKLVSGFIANEQRSIVFCEKLFELGFVINNNDDNYCKFVEVKLVKPLFKIQIELTKMCNLQCSHCYLNEKERKNKNFLSYEKCKKIISDSILLGLQEVSLTGGEIFLVDYLEEIIEYIKSENLKLRLYTNATLLDKERVKLLEKYKVDYIKVSLDSVHRLNLFKVRSIKYSDKFFENLNMLSLSSIKLEITTVVMRYNINEINEIMDFVKSRLNATHYIDAYIPNCLKEKDPLYISEMEFAKIISKRTNVKYNVVKNTYCGISRDFIYVGCDGFIKKCPMIYNEKYNIDIHTIDNIWNSISKFELKCEKYLECKYAELCGGGCRARGYAISNKNINAEDKYCCTLYKLLEDIGGLDD